MVHNNILTAEVKANGFGAVDMDRLALAIDQIAVTCKFNGEKPKPSDVFDVSFLPMAAEREVP